MDKAKKKRIKRYITWASMALVVALLTVMPLIAKSEAEADGPQASILSAQVKQESITSELRGGGTLEDLDDENVIIPTGVKITEFLVKNGDVVEKGTPLARVDKTSVMAAITSVSETMEYLREELEDGRNEKVAEKITAVPGGRVKKIFAREGESVQEVMLRDGALAVLSIDSMMAVEIEIPSALGTGENVQITLADGTAVAGRVESNLDGKVVVTVEDEGYAVGQEVKVEGLGTGVLYIHNAWKATAYSGTISKIHVKEEQTLSENASMFTLEDREFEGQLQHRANQHREYEQLLRELTAMYQSGTIDAPCEGIVSGVDGDSVHLLSAEVVYQLEPLHHSREAAYQVVFLSAPAKPEECTGKADCKASQHDKENHECIDNREENKTCPAEENHQDTCISLCKKAEQAAACPAKTHHSQCIHSCTKGTDSQACAGKLYHYPDCVETCDPAKGTSCPATGTHKKTCIQRCGHADTESGCDAEGKHHLDCICSCTGSESCPASKHKTDCFFSGMVFTAYPAKVDAVGTGALIAYASNKVYYVERYGSSWVLSNGAKLDETLMVNQTTIPTANAAAFKKGDVVLVVSGQNGDGSKTWNGVVMYKASSIPAGGFGDMDLSGMLGGMMGNMDLSALMDGLDLSGMMGGFAGFGNYMGGTGTEETEALHDLEGSTLLTVTPHKTMKLTITLDEQDVAKVTTGMKAQVKAEALKNQVFPAEVTKVSHTGTNNGGSSKFTVELTLDASRDMIPGMSATAVIPLDTRENVLTIPVAAVYEQDGKALVYTSQDDKTGEPAKAVEITTGVSDGAQVEVTSGLNPGDTVYYSYYDTLELDTSAEAERFTLG